MAYGAGTVAARSCGAREIVDPRPAAVGSIAEAYARHPHLGAVLPALGYSAEQRRELAETIAASGAEVVVDASPARLDRFLELAIPTVRVRYRFEQRAGPPLLELVAAAVARGRGMP
jgi:predicted GTPase